MTTAAELANQRKDYYDYLCDLYDNQFNKSNEPQKRFLSIITAFDITYDHPTHELKFSYIHDYKKRIFS